MYVLVDLDVLVQRRLLELAEAFGGRVGCGDTGAGAPAGPASSAASFAAASVVACGVLGHAVADASWPSLLGRSFLGGSLLGRCLRRVARPAALSSRTVRSSSRTRRVSSSTSPEGARPSRLTACSTSWRTKQHERLAVAPAGVDQVLGQRRHLPRGRLALLGQGLRRGTRATGRDLGQTVGEREISPECVANHVLPPCSDRIERRMR